MAGESPPWIELLGSKKWQGLLNPLHLSLRELILLAGDLTQATYDAFNSDQHSLYCGSSRYGKRNFFDKVSFPAAAARFEVVEFLYATSEIDLPASFLLFSLSHEAWSKESNWVGYVAVSSDAAAAAAGHREIYVAWRGTIRDLEWVDVIQPELVHIDSILNQTSDDLVHEDDKKPKVMKGWHTIYTSSNEKSPFTKTSARTQLIAKINQLVQLYRGEALSIVCVGHSLGASLAILSAFDIVQSGLSKITDQDSFPVCAIVFGSPQVGNEAFNERLEKLENLEILHVKNVIDIIPHYPSRLLGYVYTGVEVLVDTRKSPYLKDSKNPGDWHNLQGILQAVAGWNGEDKEFEFRVKRSIALVNKSSNFLKEECMVPGSWWVEKNKGMVLGEDGQWRLAPPPAEDVPAPPGSTEAVRVAEKAETMAGGEGKVMVVAGGVPVLVDKKTGGRFSILRWRPACLRCVNRD